VAVRCMRSCLASGDMGTGVSALAVLIFSFDIVVPRTDRPGAARIEPPGDDPHPRSERAADDPAPSLVPRLKRLLGELLPWPNSSPPTGEVQVIHTRRSRHPATTVTDQPGIRRTYSRQARAESRCGRRNPRRPKVRGPRFPQESAFPDPNADPARLAGRMTGRRHLPSRDMAREVKRKASIVPPVV